MSKPRYRPFNTKEISWRVPLGGRIEIVGADGSRHMATRRRLELVLDVPPARECQAVLYRLL